jgi:hypothetical protein
VEDLKATLQEIGYSLTDHGSHYRSRPIYRDSDNETVLSIDKKTGKWFDFKERIGGSFNDLVKISLGLKNSTEVEKWLSNKVSFSSDNKQEDHLIKEPATYPLECLNRLFPIYDYWKNRGVSEETLIHFRSGLAVTGKMANRYVFPIFNSKSQILGFAGRDVLSEKNPLRPKWKLVGRKSNWCYPLSFNKQEIINEKEILIVESIGDMLSLWEAGIKNVAVSFGLDIPPSLVKFLLKIDISKIKICLNNDENKNEAGNIAAHQMNAKLSKFFDSDQISIDLPPKKDFGEMSKEEILQWKIKKK